MIWKPAGLFPGLSWGWIVLDFFVQFCFFCFLAPTRDCVVTHINVVRCCVAVGWLSVCMCVNLQVIMSSPLLWLVAVSIRVSGWQSGSHADSRVKDNLVRKIK